MTINSARIQAKGQVTIPKHIREQMEVQPGDLVTFLKTEKGILIKPAAVRTKDSVNNEIRSAVAAIRESFADYSAEEIDALVDQAVKAARASD